MPGMVFKNIAERIYALNSRLTPEDCKIDSALIKMPYVKNGSYYKTKSLLDNLGIVYKAPSHVSDWITSSTAENQIELNTKEVHQNTVPNVIGMGARDALYLLESMGLQTTLSGRGKVKSQSLSEGTIVKRGAKIHILLE